MIQLGRGKIRSGLMVFDGIVSLMERLVTCHHCEIRLMNLNLLTSCLCMTLQLQEIFRKKNEKKGRRGDADKSAQLVRKPVTGCFMLLF